MADSDKKSGIDTGTPGFDIDGQTHTMDVGPVDAPGFDPVVTQHGDMSVDHEPKDISRRTKETLADYIGKKTTVNRYPVDGKSVDASITSKNGGPMPPTATQNSHSFVPREQLDRGHPGLREDPRVELRGELDGHDMLRNIGPDSSAARYVSSVLKNNRFTSERKMIGDAFRAPDKRYDPTLTHPELGEVTMERLAQVGPILAARSSQELHATRDGFNPTSPTAAASAVLPSPNQAGVSKVGVGLLEARDVLAGLTTEKVSDASFISPNGKSWGQLNNPNDPFSGFGATGMIALSVLLTTTVVATFEGLSALVSVVSTSPTVSRDLSGRHVLGASSIEKNSNPLASTGLGDFSLNRSVGPSLLGIRSTVSPFGQALRKGVEVFFGIEGSLLDGLRQSVSTPGFNVTVARTIIRSSTQTVEMMRSIFNPPGGASAANNVIALAEQLRRSKFIAAMNVFAQLGDRFLTQPKDEVAETLPGEAFKVSRVDSISDNAPGAAHRKSRMRDAMKLAWSGNRTHSLHLVPNRVLGMSQKTKLGGFAPGVGLQEQGSRLKLKLLDVTDRSQNTGRISARDVEEYEAKLDAEHMPFYFHDLRTNEVTSFHAFVTELGDTFTAQYESTPGFGRVEDVMTYKGTKRSISLGFYVVATSESDFNDVWLKVNKLVTLLYPQFTQGRSLTDGNGSEFIQPFTQTVGAAPLIRIRLGDVMRSNYSRFALARLFGAGYKTDLNLNGKVDDFKVDDVAGNPLVDGALKIGSSGWYASSDGIAMDVLGFRSPLPFGDSAQVFAPGGDAMYLPVTIDAPVESEDAYIVTPNIISAADLMAYYGMDKQSANAKVEELKRIYKNRNRPETNVVGGKYKVPKASLRPSPMLAHKLGSDTLFSSAEVFGDVISSQLDALQKFMDPSQNALVKAFNSVKGKGLAGFITDMSVNWFDETVWETAPGSRAPKVFRVSMTFSPIHDITPGLAADGYNRAPVYPVGWSGPGQDKK